MHDYCLYSNLDLTILKILYDFKSDSNVTKDDAIELGKKLNKELAKKYKNN